MWPLRSQSEVPGMLAITSSSQDGAAMSEFAKSQGLALTVVSTIAEASDLAAKANIAVILLDRDLAGRDWRPSVRTLSQYRTAPCVILASSVIDEYLFEECVKQGGFDTLAKPLRPDELRRIGGLALNFWKSRTAGVVSG